MYIYIYIYIYDYIQVTELGFEIKTATAKIEDQTVFEYLWLSL